MSDTKKQIIVVLKENGDVFKIGFGLVFKEFLKKYKEAKIKIDSKMDYDNYKSKEEILKILEPLYTNLKELNEGLSDSIDEYTSGITEALIEIMEIEEKE